jgi:hypothetical protein
VFEGVMRSFMPSLDGPRDYALYAITDQDHAVTLGTKVRM